MTLMMKENPIQLKELSRIYKSTKMNDDGIIVIEYMTYLKQKKTGFFPKILWIQQIINGNDKFFFHWLLLFE